MTRWEVDEWEDGPQTHVFVRSVPTNAIVARFEPNPGSDRFSVRFTAGDNILTTWGCGTNCPVAVLFDRRGRDLHAHLEDPNVSPDGTLALELSPFEPFGSGETRWVDLRTGRTIHNEARSPVHGDEQCCVSWASDHVSIRPCDRRVAEWTLPIPRH